MTTTRTRSLLTTIVAIAVLAVPGGAALAATAYEDGNYKGPTSQGRSIKFKAGNGRVTKVVADVRWKQSICGGGAYSFKHKPKVKADGSFRFVHTFRKDRVVVAGRLTGSTAKGTFKAKAHLRGGRTCTASYTWTAALEPPPPPA